MCERAIELVLTDDLKTDLMSLEVGDEMICGLVIRSIRPGRAVDPNKTYVDGLVTNINFNSVAVINPDDDPGGVVFDGIRGVDIGCGVVVADDENRDDDQEGETRQDLPTAQLWLRNVFSSSFSALRLRRLLRRKAVATTEMTLAVSVVTRMTIESGTLRSSRRTRP